MEADCNCVVNLISVIRPPQKEKEMEGEGGNSVFNLPSIATGPIQYPIHKFQGCSLNTNVVKYGRQKGGQKGGQKSGPKRVKKDRKALRLLKVYPAVARRVRYDVTQVLLPGCAIAGLGAKHIPASTPW